MGAKVKKCIICGGKKFKDYSKDVVSCSSCGLVVAREIPSSKEIDDLYQKEYFFGMEYSDYKVDRPALEHNFRKRIKRLGYTLPSNGMIVELGSAYGYFLNLIKDRVKTHLGFEISTDGVEYSVNKLKVKAINDDFMKHKFKKNSVDSVFMWDVIEHLAEPDVYLQRISEILKPGGHLVFTTGNIGRLVPRLRKDKWRMIHPPTHIYYFSDKTVTKLLEKYGFKVKKIYHKGLSRNVGSMGNQIIYNRKALGKHVKSLEALYSVAEKAKITRLNLALNTGDIMELVAVKAK